MGISGIIQHYHLMTLPKFKKIMKINKGFSTILGPDNLPLEPHYVCFYLKLNIKRLQGKAHIDMRTHWCANPDKEFLKNRLICITALFICHIFVAARLLNSFSRESAFMPVLIVSLQMVEHHVTKSFFYKFFCMCVCVRLNHSQQKQKPEPSLSQTTGRAFCSVSYVCIMQCFIIRPHLMICKRCFVELVLAHLLSVMESSCVYMCLYCLISWVQLSGSYWWLHRTKLTTVVICVQHLFDRDGWDALENTYKNKIWRRSVVWKSLKGRKTELQQYLKNRDQGLFGGTVMWKMRMELFWHHGKPKVTRKLH